MSVSAPTIRPQAQLVRAHDGDTYLFLLDVHGSGLTEAGCETAWVRLRGFSARELTDTLPADRKGLDRVNGVQARALAQQVLQAAKQITVELVGPAGPAQRTFDRYVATVYVDGQSLGELLAQQHAVSPGAFEGEPGFKTGGVVPSHRGRV